MYEICSITIIFKKKKNKYDNFFKAKTNKLENTLSKNVLDEFYVFFDETHVKAVIHGVRYEITKAFKIQFVRLNLMFLKRFQKLRESYEYVGFLVL